MDHSRRRLLRNSALATTGFMLVGSNTSIAENHSSSLTLNAAGYPYDHVKAFMTGEAEVKGCEVQFEVDKIGNLNKHVFIGPQSRGITEIGLGPFMLAYANDDFRAYSLIPVFPLRVFRHKSIFVHADAGIDHPSQLKGKRVGTPGYSSSSLQWIRGMLQDEYDVSPEDIEWVISAVDSSAAVSGTVSKNENVFPDDLSVTVGPAGKDESDLLVDRDVDALFHAIEPKAFVEGDPKVRRLFSDVRATEQDYFRRTGIYPIMHSVAIRRDLIEQHPWLPKAVFDAYSLSKSMTYAAMRQKVFFQTLPWYAQEMDATQDLMGENFHPYGIGPNRKTLDTFYRYSYEQGLASRQLTIEELFHPSSLDFVEP